MTELWDDLRVFNCLFITKKSIQGSYGRLHNLHTQISTVKPDMRLQKLGLTFLGLQTTHERLESICMNLINKIIKTLWGSIVCEWVII